MWQDIPDYLSDRIESVQKKVLKIIYPDSSYSQALSLANDFATDASSQLGHNFMTEMADTRDHPLLCLVSTVVQRTNPYNLRPGSSRTLKKFMRTKSSENCFTCLNI